MTILVQVHAAATLAMVGIIWFVQIVHYPLMKRVGEERFPAYEAAHTRLTARIVGPPMLVEAVSAVLLVWRLPGAGFAAVTGLGLLTAIWISTALVQVPCHRKLALGFDAAVHQRLVTSNWLRTAAWTLRGAVALWFLVPGLSDAYVVRVIPGRSDATMVGEHQTVELAGFMFIGNASASHSTPRRPCGSLRGLVVPRSPRAGTSRPGETLWLTSSRKTGKVLFAEPGRGTNPD